MKSFIKILAGAYVLNLLLFATAVNADNTTIAWGKLRLANESREPLAKIWTIYTQNRQSFSRFPKPTRDNETLKNIQDHKQLIYAAVTLKPSEVSIILNNYLKHLDAASQFHQSAVVRQDLLKLFCESGFFDQAIIVFDRIEKQRAKLLKKVKGLDSNLAQILKASTALQFLDFYVSIGSWESVEQILENFAIASKKSEALTGMSLPMGSPILFVPDLANAKFHLGKVAEAGQLMDQFFIQEKQYLKKLKQSFFSMGEMNGDSKFLYELYELGIKARSRLIAAEINLHVGNIDSAKKNLRKAKVSLDQIIINFRNNKKLDSPAESAEQQLSYHLERYFGLSFEAALASQNNIELLDIAKSWEKYLTKMGEYSPAKIHASQSLAWAYFLNGETKKFQLQVNKTLSAQSQLIGAILNIGSEHQKLLFHQDSDLFSLAATSGNPELLFDNLVRLKGSVMQSTTEHAIIADNHNDSQKAEFLNALKIAENNLLGAVLSGNAIEIATYQRSADLIRNRYAMEYGKSIGTKIISVRWKHVQQSLKTDEIYLDYFRYRKIEKNGHWAGHYGLVMLKKDGLPQYFELGLAKTIDSLVKKTVDFSKGVPTNSRMADVLRLLYQKLIAPVKSDVSEVKRIWISPDSQLNQIPFCILLDANHKFLIESVETAYVVSARDLIGNNPNYPISGKALLVGNPDFNFRHQINSEGSRRLRPIEAHAFDTTRLPRCKMLPGTQIEINSVASVLSDAGYDVLTLFGKDANEMNIRKHCSKKLEFIHYGTHGFVISPPAGRHPSEITQTGLHQLDPRGFNISDHPRTAMDKVKSTGSPAGKAVDRPLNRSMLALSGANLSLEEWKKGFVYVPSRDGLLMASEITSMDLSGVYLTTLSACNSGLGEPVRGDGILGLRRAFINAGSKNTLVTSWALNDDFGAMFFSAFYSNLNTSKNPIRALHITQKNQLVMIRNRNTEGGLANAVYYAGSFCLWTRNITK